MFFEAEIRQSVEEGRCSGICLQQASTALEGKHPSSTSAQTPPLKCLKQKALLLLPDHSRTLGQGSVSVLLK